MEKITLGYELDITEVTITGPASDLRVMPESDFFNLRDSGENLESVLPLPDGLDEWSNAQYQGGDILVGMVGNELYAIAENDRDELLLYHYVRDDGARYSLSFTLPKRKINIERKVERMNIQEYSAQVGQSRQQIPQMNLGMQQPVMAPAAPMGTGVGGAASVDRICAEAHNYGFVLGYIMGSAPATSFTLGTEKDADKNITRVIQARQSKPSGLKAVILGLPRSCVMNGENLASPQDIERAKVTFDSSNHDTVWLALSKPAAIAYIHAFQDKLPEYAPLVTNRTTQWTPQEISDGDGVSWVTVRSTADQRENAPAPFRFSLRSDSPRRSPFSEHNVVCLSAQEHISLDVKNEQQEFEVNESAFGGWRYRGVRGEDSNARMSEVALHDCADRIWTAEYTVADENGNPTTVKSFNSVYTCRPGTKTPKGQQLDGRMPIRYYPWYATGELRKTVGEKNVEKIVKRKCVPSKGKYGERMQSFRVTMKQKETHPLFRDYSTFIDTCEKLGAMSKSAIINFGEKEKNTKKRSKNELTPDQYKAISDFIKSKETSDAIRAAQKDVANREAIRSRGPVQE